MEDSMFDDACDGLIGYVGGRRERVNATTSRHRVLESVGLHVERLIHFTCLLYLCALLVKES